MMHRQRIAWTRADKKPRQVGEHAPRLMQTNGRYADGSAIRFGRLNVRCGEPRTATLHTNKILPWKFTPNPRIDGGRGEDPTPEGARNTRGQYVLACEDETRHRGLCLERAAKNACWGDIDAIEPAMMMSRDRLSGQRRREIAEHHELGKVREVLLELCEQDVLDR
jgi:hypothetical protein